MNKIFTKEWFIAAGIRALRTFAQVAATTIGTGAVGITELDWVPILSVSATAAVMSLLTSLAGLPEVTEEPDKTDVY